MGEQPERKISELWTPNVDDLPIFKLAEVGSPFQIKTTIIEMVQDSPLTGKEDPNLHLRSFLQLCNTFKMEGVDDNQLRARIFPYSLTNKTVQWFYTLEVSTVEKWESLVRAFIAKFYSLEKTQTLRSWITSFAQSTTETITEAFERFNDYVRTCPRHQYSQADLVMKFYGGLQASSRQSLIHPPEVPSSTSLPPRLMHYSRRWPMTTLGHRLDALNSFRPWEKQGARKRRSALKTWRPRSTS
ncbi:unnamed protein product [Urochloa humidicola]